MKEKRNIAPFQQLHENRSCNNVHEMTAKIPNENRNHVEDRYEIIIRIVTHSYGVHNGSAKIVSQKLKQFFLSYGPYDMDHQSERLNQRELLLLPHITNNAENNMLKL